MVIFKLVNCVYIPFLGGGGLAKVGVLGVFCSYQQLFSPDSSDFSVEARLKWRGINMPGL